MEKYLFWLIPIILSPLLNSFSRKYIDPILPEKKIAISFLVNLLLLIFKYILPILVIVFSYLNSNFDKLYIVVNCFMFSILFTNATLDSTRMNRMLIYDRFKKRFDQIEKKKSRKNKSISY